LNIKKFVLGAIETNCYIVSCPETREAVIIDPGDHSPSPERYIKEERLLVKCIINTHSHFDHTGGNRKLKEVTGAQLLIHRAEADVLLQTSTFALMFGLQVEDSPPADAFMAEGDEISFGQVTLNVLETPGHSPGSVTLHTDDVAFVGDAVFAGSIGRTDLPGGSHSTLIKSIKEKILPLGDDTVLYSGHGPETTVAQEKLHNPFLR
jgi:glyoxylase-like metal-dependent hydrolase (beta-lactamase superfamily II)